MLDSRQPFALRVTALAKLGLGISTEFGAGRHGLDLIGLAREHPELLQFLEIGADLERGYDADARAWIAAGAPVTYHFLDANLEESESLSPAWIAATREQARAAGAAWICGDAGLWHMGPRDRGHGVLQPPVLTRASARAMAENVRRLREELGFEVLPENPPAHVYLGDLHILEYFARVAEEADCGLLLDVSHLAIYQHAAGLDWKDALDLLPAERVVEIHVAGARLFTHRGRVFVDDDHGPEPLAQTWKILEHVLPRASQLRALVYEGERNSRKDAIARLRRLSEMLGAASGTQPAEPARERDQQVVRIDSAPSAPICHRELQRTLFRMQLDTGFAAELAERRPDAVASTGLDAASLALLLAADARAIEADHEGRRRAQFLRNLAGEFPITLALVSPEVLEGFTASRAFHGAVAGARSLPLALGEYLADALVGSDALRLALFGLELRLARARRATAASLDPEPGHVLLSPDVELAVVPEGTFAAASAVRSALDQQRAIPPLRPLQTEHDETLLIHPQPQAHPFQLRSVHVERLAPAVAELLLLCRTPQSPASLASYAAQCGVDPQELREVIESFRSDSVLLGVLGG